MFDFFRDRGQSADDKRSEQLNAYLDGALSGRERDQLEAQLQQDAALRAELGQFQMVRQQLRAMPRRRVPRSFTLDPALYSPPKPQRSQQFYPVLRGATALAAFLFVFVLGLSLINFSPAGDAAPVQSVTLAEPEAIMMAPQEESAAPALTQEIPQGAGGGIAPEATTIEEPPMAEMEESTAAEADAAEELSLQQANPLEPVEESARETADSSAPKDLEATGGVTMSVPAEALESYAAADEAADANGEAATSAALMVDAAPAVEPAVSYGVIAAWLGIATLVLGLLTLLLRSRSKI